MPWPTIDSLLVFGERQRDAASGEERHRYPSLAELASRYGISSSLVWRYANKSKCFERRKEAHARTQARTQEKIVEKLSDERAIAASDVLGLVDDFLRSFGKALREGKVRTDSAGDLEKMIRVRELLTGGADARTELQAGLSLEAIQERHRRQRGQAERLTPELTGATRDGDAHADDTRTEERARGERGRETSRTGGGGG